MERPISPFRARPFPPPVAPTGVGDHESARRAVDADDRADQTSEQIGDAARTLLETRAAARADAFTAVTRARVRGGRPPDAWSPLDAELAVNISEMLRSVQGQDVGALEPAFAKYAPDITRLAAAAEIELSIHGKAPPTDDKGGDEKAPEAPMTETEPPAA